MNDVVCYVCDIVCVVLYVCVEIELFATGNEIFLTFWSDAHIPVDDFKKLIEKLGVRSTKYVSQ